jgi:crotonobetainyl-CoA:carnitine CoA-transferase CaiB-like acyl-CoA transferase
MSGIMSLTGEPDGEPMRYPVPISDMTVGLYALSASWPRCTSASAPAGAGHRRSDPRIADGLADQPGRQLLCHRPNPPRMGNIHPTITPYQPFPTADGWIIIAGGTDRIWVPAVRCARHPAGGARRSALRVEPAAQRQPAEVQAMLVERFKTQARTIWLERLREADVPPGRSTC